MKRRVPPSLANLHQLEWSCSCSSGQLRASPGRDAVTCCDGMSLQSQGTLTPSSSSLQTDVWVFLMWEGWLCFTHRSLWVFLTGGIKTLWNPTPAERGRKAWIFHDTPCSTWFYVSASCKQSTQPPLMSFITALNLKEKENTLNVESERTWVLDESCGSGVNSTSFPGSFPKCTGKILME